MDNSIAINPTTSNVYYIKQRQTGGGGKAVISAFLPGVGQLVDNRVVPGIISMGACAGAGLLAMSGMRINQTAEDIKEMDNFMEGLKNFKLAKDSKKTLNKQPNEIIEKAEKKLSKNSHSKNDGTALVLIGGILYAIAWLYNVYDAYKGDREPQNFVQIA